MLVLLEPSPTTNPSLQPRLLPLECLPRMHACIAAIALGVVLRSTPASLPPRELEEPTMPPIISIVIVPPVVLELCGALHSTLVFAVAPLVSSKTLVLRGLRAT